MSAAERRDGERDGWRRMQERIRYEVLHMLYRAAGAEPERRVDAWGFALDLGVWHEEVWNTLVWLEQADMVRIHDARPLVSITLTGIRYIEKDARLRRTIRGIAPPPPEAE